MLHHKPLGQYVVVPFYHVVDDDDLALHLSRLQRAALAQCLGEVPVQARVLAEGQRAPERGGSGRGVRAGGGGSVQGLICSGGIFFRGFISA